MQSKYIIVLVVSVHHLSVCPYLFSFPIGGQKASRSARGVDEQTLPNQLCPCFSKDIWWMNKTNGAIFIDRMSHSWRVSVEMILIPAVYSGVKMRTKKGETGKADMISSCQVKHSINHCFKFSWVTFCWFSYSSSNFKICIYCDESKILVFPFFNDWCGTKQVSINAPKNFLHSCVNKRWEANDMLLHFACCRKYPRIPW